ncbi:uncharacterized protein LOC131885641 [Tigriopus californicus]|nr:uncharacterized protein LOC131885641 [Tigriopus californicus]
MYGEGLGGGIHSSSNSLRRYVSSPCSSHTSYTSVQSSPSYFPHFPSPELISPENTIKMSQRRSFVRSGDSGLAGMDFQMKSEKSPTHASGVEKSKDVSNIPQTRSSSDSDIFSTLSPVSNREYKDEVISYLQFDKEDDTKTPKVCRRKNLRSKLASTDSSSRSKIQGKHKQIPDKEYCQEIAEDRSVSDTQDAQSVSTVSGTGMNFFRKFVQRKKRHTDDRKDDKSDSLVSSKPPDTEEDRESQARFRREVLIERLVSDALSMRSGTDSSCSSASSTTEEDTWNDFLRDPLDLEEIQDALSSISSVKTNARSSLNLSSVSGSGLKFLRNYLRKKKPNLSKAEQTDRNPAFNGVPVPYPPLDDFYGPAYLSNDDIDMEDKRMSIASTIANLLNESFNSDEDSELENLDWDDWMDQEASTQLGDLVSLAHNIHHSNESEASASRDDTPIQDVMASTQRTPWSTPCKGDAKKMDTFSKMSNSLPLANVQSKKSAQDPSNSDMSFMIVGCPPLANPELDDFDELNRTKVGHHDQHGLLEQGSNGHGGRHNDRRKQGQQYSVERRHERTGTPQETLYLLETFDTDKDPPIMASVKRRTRKSEHLKKIDDGARLRNAQTSSLLSASSQNSSHSNNKHSGSPGGNFGTSSSLFTNYSRWPSESSNQSTPNAENSSSSRSTGTSCSTPSPNPQFDCQLQAPDLTSRNRLVSFWNERVSNPTDEIHPTPNTFKRSISDGGCQLLAGSAGFKPVFPSYYKPETHDLANERIQAFVNATRKAANDAQMGDFPMVDSINSSAGTTPNSLEKWEQNRSELKLLKCQSDTKAKEEPKI